MSYWLPSTGRLFLPPPTPVSKILDTDDFVKRTDIYYHTSTERLLTVGHPYFEIKGADGTVEVPKVSGSQFRVFRLIFPDPNKFSFPNPNVYNPENQRLVWAIRGLEFCRGQPLGIGVTGHPLFNKLDAENRTKYPNVEDDDRQNIGVDPKQVQMFIVGCTPCEGEHWDKAEPCKPQAKGSCPPIQLVNSTILDGEMCDIGFGNMNFKNLQATRSGVPLDIVNQTVKYPDFLKMGSDPYGNQMFFYAKRESMYVRHLWSRAGTNGDGIPPEDGPGDFMIPNTAKVIAPPVYYGTPSGSLVSSDVQIYNRPFWIQRAQGTNNGVCWNNQLFVTAVDSTRGTNFTISVQATGDEADERTYNYKAKDFKHYLRHVEEWELSFIMQLCIVDLTPETLSHLNTMDSKILDNWNLGFVQPAGNIEDQYRNINSLATRCPGKNDAPKDTEDPYDKMNFWKVDLSDRFSLNLEQFSLGRKFLYQTGNRQGGTKRPAPKTVSFESKRSVKRKKKSA
ncbi:L1 protein [Bos taurus papillomavirus 12]|uniref:Major capsid protein L1 n=3 Tax=Papillomaviridae TaxID=151340 RepID=G1CR77_9PAPI|nr:L1 protein [Bos taurus papillomavirus 12]AEL99908.1 L1 protein [Bos taurus papillomavirus 12]AEL99912.1 L1 protein [Bos taurus papillomavirus 12]